MYIRNYRLQKMWLDQCLKSFVSEHLRQSPCQRVPNTLIIFFHRGKLLRKMSLLVICEILEHFVDTSTADNKYSSRNSEILLEPIQMQLSKKQINFSEFFASFLKSKSIFQRFQEEDDLHSLYIV